MSYIYDKYKSSLQYLFDFRDGSMYERMQNVAPSVTGTLISMPPGNGLRVTRGASTSYATYGSGANLRVTDWTQPFTIIVDVTVASKVYATTIYPYVFGQFGTGVFPGHSLYFDSDRSNLAFSLGYSNSNFEWTDVLPLNSIRKAIGGRVVAICSFNGTWSTNAFMSYSQFGWTATGNVTGAAPPLDCSGSNVFTVGSVYPGGPQYQWNGDIKLIAKISGKLSASEMVQLFEETWNEPTASSRAYSIPARNQSKTKAEYTAIGTVIDVDCTNIQSGACIDRVNGKRFNLLSGADLSVKSAPFGGQITSRATVNGKTNGGMWCSNIGNANLSGQDFSIEFWATSRNIGDTAYWAVMARNSNGTEINWQWDRISFFSGASREIGRTMHTRVAGKQYHIVVTIAAGATSCQFYIDGVAATTTNPVPNALTFGANAGVGWGALSATGNSNTLPGEVSNFQIHASVLTPTEIRQRYLQGAKAIVFDGRLPRDGSAPVTPVAISTAGAQIPGTPWKTLGTSSMKVVEENLTSGLPGRRSIQGPSCIWRSPAAPYGSWYFRFTLDNAVNIYYLRIGNVNTTASFGVYWGGTQVIFRNFAAVTVFSGPTNVITVGTEYEYWLTRSYDSVFTLWIRGGAYSNWTLFPTISGSNPTASGTMSTYTTGTGIWYNNVGSPAGVAKLGDVMQFQGEMTPTEATQLGLLPMGMLTFGQFSTTKLSQSFIIKADTGATYDIEWGDGTMTSMIGTSASQTITHTYSAAGTYVQKWKISDPTKLRMFFAYNNTLSGDLTALATYCTGLTYVDISYNSFSGVLPSFASCTGLQYFFCHVNSFSGALPSFNACTGLIYFYCQQNGFTGALPSFAACTAMYSFACGTNSFAGALPSFASWAVIKDIYINSCGFTSYAGGGIASTCVNFYANSNALIQASVDSVLADFASGVAGRPNTGFVYLTGGTNATPSAAGLASKAAFLAAKPAWTIANN